MCSLGMKSGFARVKEMRMCRCPIPCPHIEDLQQEGRKYSAVKAREKRERLTLTLKHRDTHVPDPQVSSQGSETDPLNPNPLLPLSVT